MIPTLTLGGLGKRPRTAPIIVNDDLYNAIIAASPVNYWRHADATGSVMHDEVAVDGTYIGTATPFASIYTGGPTCMRGWSATSAYGFSSSFPTSLVACSFIGIVKIATLSGFKPVLANRDANGGGRLYQIRLNGSSMEFVRINNFVGPVETIATPSGIITANTTVMLAVTIATPVAGVSAIKFYRNGVLFHTDVMTAADFGVSGDVYEIGYFGGGGTYSDGFHSETAVFNYELSGATLAAMATAAGL